MAMVQVFDPAMCCSTGVCGPSVDPKLVRFAADLDWLKSKGVSVERFNLAQQPAAFASNAQVKAALEASVEDALPLVMVDGKVQSTGRYPSRAELADWAGIAVPEPSLYTDAIAELVAIGAAIASNCEACFKFHFDKARNLGVSEEDMLSAVRTAQVVKETPSKAVLALAERFLSAGARGQAAAPRFTPVKGEPCRSGDGVAKNGACC